MLLVNMCIRPTYHFDRKKTSSSTLNGVERWMNKGAGSENVFGVTPTVFTYFITDASSKNNAYQVCINS